MRGPIGCGVLAVAAFVGLGVAVGWVAKHRANQDRLYCANNLRALGQFADVHARLSPDRPLFADEKGRPAPTREEQEKLRRELAGPATVPPGTVPNPALPPDRRLSWVVLLLPALPAGRQDTRDLFAAVDRAAAWDDPKHQALSRAPLELLRCYGKTPSVPFDSPAVTQFVGTGGVGADAPALPWPEPAKPHPRAGAFRYDAPTPFDAITDGTSGTVLFAETDFALGPWLRGGPATVRTLDAAPAARAPVGVGGQFGGTHPGGGNFAFADYSVRFLSDRTAPEVLHAVFTIAGGASDPVPGE